MVYNRIPVTFDQLPRITAPYINYQYDVVQILVINGLDLPDYYTVDFCNVGDAETITITGTPDGVRIPNDLLLTGLDIKAYIILTGIDEGAVETRYEVTIPVRNRPMRSGVTPTPEERLEIETLVNALNDGVERAEDAATEAESQADRAETAADNAQSAVEHYPKIEDGYWYVWLNGGWVSTGVKAEGVDGKGIASVTGQKTSTSGLVDTYTLIVTYTDSTTDTITFTVTNGRDGVDGYSPTATVTKSGNTATITITDKNGTTTATVTDGTDGVSPEVSIETITGGHRVTITDKDHPTGQSFDVMDGEVSQADLDAALATKAPVIIDTASGAIASFADGADGMPIKALTVNIEPLQDLHGQANPYPAGGGTNKWDEEWESGTYDSSSGAKSTSANSIRSINFIPVLPSTSYCAVNTAANPSIRLYYYDSSKSFIGYEGKIVTDGSVVFNTPSNCYYLCFTIGTSAVPVTTNNNNIAINYPSTVTTYSPYSNECPISGWTGMTVYQSGEDTENPSEIAVSWQTEAGTVYGGYINLITGVLTVDTRYIVADGVNIKCTGGYAGGASRVPGIDISSQSSDASKWDLLVTSYLKAVRYADAERNSVCLFNGGSWIALHINDIQGIGSGTPYPTDADLQTAANAYLQDNPLQIVYPLATPVEYQLDPITISTLYGQNNIFADCGDVSVDYPCDTKLYIDRPTEPAEDDMIADSLIASGKYFFVNNRLFLSTASIAVGAMIIPGSNCTETSIAEALNTLNS